MLTALPVGIFSDKLQRHIIARFSAVLDGVAITISITALLTSASFKLYLFLAAAILWGASSANDSNMDALFADSIPTGQRALQFTQMLAISRACLGAGPLIAAFIFHMSGATSALSKLPVMKFALLRPWHSVQQKIAHVPALSQSAQGMRKHK